MPHEPDNPEVEGQRDEPTLDQPRARPASDFAPTEDLQSDVRLASDETVAAPSFREPVPRVEQQTGPTVLEHGEQIDDFEIEKVLGRGAFGVVYLARQLSLDRRVALKVAPNEGSEGRTMARLEHDHIVQVFSESVDSTKTKRLLCMKLVPGVSLEGVIQTLHRREDDDRPGWNGQDYLAIVESRAVTEDLLDTSALHDRELLAGFDATQSTAWVGARLAEAVGYAHSQGVLHRDIKPANVLVNQYGRPMLADFNISFRSFEKGATPDSTFGGTLAFMAPEHLDAFNPATVVMPEEVDEQSDVYSLGIVVYELLTGERPFKDPARTEQRTSFLGRMADSRRDAPPPFDDEPPSARKTLLRTLAKSLEGEKQDRYKSGPEFAAALDGARRLATAERELPSIGWLFPGISRAPFRWLVLLAIVPQLVGSAVNISYNLFEIVDKQLTEEQGGLFLNRLVPIYNAIVYPLLIGILVWAISPVFFMWRRLASGDRVDEQEVAAARRRAVSLPLWMLGVAAVGWLPGGGIFPLLIDRMLDQPVDASVYAHFVTSFTISGLVAVAYSFCGLQFLLLQVFYPRMWADATRFRSIARKELRGTAWRLRFINILSGSIPAIAAVAIGWLLILQLQQEVMDGSVRLCVILIALVIAGGVGREITTTATSHMAKTYSAILGRST